MKDIHFYDVYTKLNLAHKNKLKQNKKTLSTAA